MATDLRPSYYNKQPPFELLQESDSIRTSTTELNPRLLQCSTFPSVLETPPVDEPPRCHPNSTVGRPSVGFLMKPDLSNGQSSDKLLHQANSRWTPLAIRLLPNFSNRKSPSRLLQQMTSACSISTQSAPKAPDNSGFISNLRDIRASLRL